MDDRTQVVVGALLFVAGFACFIAIKIWRGFSRKISTSMFWLHLAAPLIGIAIMLIGLILAALAIDRAGERKRLRDEGKGQIEVGWPTFLGSALFQAAAEANGHGR